MSSVSISFAILDNVRSAGCGLGCWVSLRLPGLQQMAAPVPPLFFLISKPLFFSPGLVALPQKPLPLPPLFSAKGFKYDDRSQAYMGCGPSCCFRCRQLVNRRYEAVSGRETQAVAVCHERCRCPECPPNACVLLPDPSGASLTFRCVFDVPAVVTRWGEGNMRFLFRPLLHRCGGFSVSSARRTLLRQQVASPCRRVYPPKVDPSRINFIPNLGATQVRVNRYCRWYEMMDLSSGCCIVPTPLYCMPSPDVCC